MKQIPDLPPGTILLVEVGSTAHGTGLEGQEDHDEIGIVIESPKQVFVKGAEMLNVMHRTQPEGTQSGPGDTDRHLYSLRSFLSLALQGNPSIMMCLWAPVIQSSHVGHELQRLAPNFVGRHIIPRYRGYMKSQVERILGTRGGGHGKRGGGGRPELIEQHGWDTKYAMHAARLGLQCVELLETNKLELPIQGASGTWLRALRRGMIDFEWWWQEVLRLDAQLERMYHSNKYFRDPQYEVINEWSIETHRQFHNAPDANVFRLMPYGVR